MINRILAVAVGGVAACYVTGALVDRAEKKREAEVAYLAALRQKALQLRTKAEDPGTPPVSAAHLVVELHNLDHEIQKLEQKLRPSKPEVN